MYHGVEQRPGPLFVEPTVFAEHVDVIAASGLPVLTVGEVGERLRDGRLPRLGVALTFDDAFTSVVEEAAPRLLKRDLRATVFCVAGRLGGTNEWPTARPGAPRVELASVAELSQLAEAGFEIGAHGMEHAPLDTEDLDEIQREVVDVPATLEHLLGTRAHSFAYPYGAPPTPVARRAVSETYAAACTTRVGRVREGSNPLSLPRVDAHYLRSPDLLEATLQGRSNLYLALRGLAADARRRVRSDYSRPAAAR